MLGVKITTVCIILLKAVFRLQAKLNLTNNVKIAVAFVEEKNIEIEVAIFFSKTNFHDVSSANSVLEVDYRGLKIHGGLPG